MGSGTKAFGLLHASLGLPIGVPSRAASTGGAAASMPKYRNTCQGIMSWPTHEQYHMCCDDCGSGRRVGDILIRLCVLGGLACMNGSCVRTHVKSFTADDCPVQGIFPSLPRCLLTWSLLASTHVATSILSFSCCWCYICNGVGNHAKICICRKL